MLALQIFAADCAKGVFFGVPHWFNGLKFDSECNIINFSFNDIWTVVLNLTRIALAVAAILAIGFIIFGGIRLITSAGNPEQTAAARKLIVSAVMGLLISVLANAIVGFVVARLV